MPRILIVDDDPILMCLVKESLIRGLDNVVIEMAETFVDANQLVNKNDFDLALVDIMLPDGNGIDLLSHLRLTNPSVLVFIMTVTDLPEYRSEARQRGAVRFLRKPFDFGKLVAEVKEVLDKEVSQKKEKPKEVREGEEELHTMDILQLKCLSGGTEVIRIMESGGRVGEIHFTNGNISHAEIEEASLFGLEALKQIVLWERGKFQPTDELPLPLSDSSIEESWQAVLLKLAQEIDEKSEEPHDK